MRRFTLYILLLLLIGSCKKDHPNNLEKLHGRYQSRNTLAVKPPVMYVQNRQITDTGIIKTYLRIHNFMGEFFFAGTQSISDTLLLIEFGDNSVIKYKTNYSQRFLRATKIDSTGSLLLVLGIDSAVFQLLSYSSSLTRCDTIANLSDGAVSPLNRITLLPLTSGYYGFITHFDKFPLIYENRELVLPLISTAYSTSYIYGSTLGKCGASMGNLWNIKNADIENRLISTDTIVVQEKSVILDKLL